MSSEAFPRAILAILPDALHEVEVGSDWHAQRRSTAETDATLSSKFHTPDDDSSSRREKWWTNGLHLVVPTHHRRRPLRSHHVRCEMQAPSTMQSVSACMLERGLEEAASGRETGLLFVEPHQSWRLYNLWARTSSAGSQLTTTVLWCFPSCADERQRPVQHVPRPLNLDRPRSRLRCIYKKNRHKLIERDCLQPAQSGSHLTGRAMGTHRRASSRIPAETKVGGLGADSSSPL